LGGLLLAVTEQLLEHEGHVVHQVDRVVPHDHDPRAVGGDVGGAGGLVDLDGCEGRHRCNSTSSRSGAGRSTGARRPSTNHNVALHTLTAPTMCTATRTTGTPLKYCT